MADEGRLVSVRGHRFRVVDDKPTFWDRAESGRWEPETLAAIAEVVSAGDAFLDIGAWVGPTALFAASLGARVLAVEADPVAHAALLANIAANPSLAQRIDVVHAAAAARDGTVRLGAARKRGDSMSSALLADGADAWTVAAVTPETLLARCTAPPGGRLVVKVDIEGGEYGLGAALASALPANASAVLLALHPRLLAAAGRTGAEIATATRDLLAAFSAYQGRILETDSGGAPLELVAARDNVTLLMTRAAASGGAAR